MQRQSLGSPNRASPLFNSDAVSKPDESKRRDSTPSIISVTGDDKIKPEKPLRCHSAQSEKLIHLIPILILFCFLILYISSHDPSPPDLAHFSRIKEKLVAFSELLPLLAVGNTSFLKIQQISQSIDIGNGIVENSTTLSTPFANFSFSASASFDVRSPSRIQVRFKEATFNPLQIKSGLDIPESVDVLGQKIPLPPAQQVLNPVQEAAGNVSGALLGLPPLKIPIPGERTESWVLVTYLDADFRISRGDGGLFVLVREGSPLLL